MKNKKVILFIIVVIVMIIAILLLSFGKKKSYDDYYNSLNADDFQIDTTNISSTDELLSNIINENIGRFNDIGLTEDDINKLSWQFNKVENTAYVICYDKINKAPIVITIDFNNNTIDFSEQ